LSGSEDQSFLGDLEGIESYLASREGADRLLPKGRIVEVVYIGLVTNFSLFRTEGTGNIDVVEIPRKGTVPVIMPQKIVAITRRRLTGLLRLYREKEKRREEERKGTNKIREILRKAAELGYIRAKSGEIDWDCWIQPPLGEGTDLGMDGFCPACTIFGAVLTQDLNQNLKKDMNIGIRSRVAMDPAFSVYPYYEFKTHQKVSEGSLSTTGTALFKEPHVEPGSIVIGKLALYDVTKAELIAVLLSLVSSERFGGGQMKYGGLKIIPVAVAGSHYETISAYQLAEQLICGEKESLEAVAKKVAEILPSKNKFKIAVNFSDSGMESKLLSELLGILDDKDDEKAQSERKYDFKQLFDELWEDALSFDEAVVNRIKWLSESRRGQK